MNNYMVVVPGHEPLGNLTSMQAGVVCRELPRVGYSATIKQEVLTTK